MVVCVAWERNWDFSYAHAPRNVSIKFANLTKRIWRLIRAPSLQTRHDQSAYGSNPKVDLHETNLQHEITRAVELGHVICVASERARVPPSALAARHRESQAAQASLMRIVLWLPRIRMHLGVERASNQALARAPCPPARLRCTGHAHEHAAAAV